MEWRSAGEWRNANLSDELEMTEARRRLLTALNPNGLWLPSLLKTANGKLSELRAHEHPEAGGLVIARDQGMARAVARIMGRFFGENPPVAISDEPEAS